jgi:hypothetical protein
MTVFFGAHFCIFFSNFLPFTIFWHMSIKIIEFSFFSTTMLLVNLFVSISNILIIFWWCVWLFLKFLNYYRRDLRRESLMHYGMNTSNALELSNGRYLWHCSGFVFLGLSFIFCLYSSTLFLYQALLFDVVLLLIYFSKLITFKMAQTFHLLFNIVLCQFHFWYN